jgi:hypothetical protein
MGGGGGFRVLDQAHQAAKSTTANFPDVVRKVTSSQIAFCYLMFRSLISVTADRQPPLIYR